MFNNKHLTLVSGAAWLFDEVCQLVWKSFAARETEFCQQKFLLDFRDLGTLNRVPIGHGKLGYHL